MQREVYIVSGVRTAIGDFGGSLKDLPPTELGAQVAREALSRANVSGDEVQHVVFGNVVHTEAKDMYLSRVAAINAGITKDAPALTLNRLCGSGLQAIVSAAQAEASYIVTTGPGLHYATATQASPSDGGRVSFLHAAKRIAATTAVKGEGQKARSDTRALQRAWPACGLLIAAAPRRAPRR